MTHAAELREGYLSYFESKGHLRLPSGSLVPPRRRHLDAVHRRRACSRSKPYFLGRAAAGAARDDRAEGDARRRQAQRPRRRRPTERHASFFEMLGNFSFGDYFKDGRDRARVGVLTRAPALHRRSALWATVFAGDPELGLGEDEAAVERLALGRDAARADRRRCRARRTSGRRPRPGPCGPNSELYLDRGEELGCGRAECAPGCECERFLEFWNLVFMEFDLGADGLVTPLPKQNVDTGMGLERAAMLLQGVDSIFEIDNVPADHVGRGAQRQALRRVGARDEGVPRDRRPRARDDVPARRRRRCPRTRAAATCCAA